MKVSSVYVTIFLIFGMEITIVICWFVFTSLGLSTSIFWDSGQSLSAQCCVGLPYIPGIMTVILGQPRKYLHQTRFSTMPFLYALMLSRKLISWEERVFMFLQTNSKCEQHNHLKFLESIWQKFILADIAKMKNAVSKIKLLKYLDNFKPSIKQNQVKAESGNVNTEGGKNYTQTTIV